jgi:hypothetical protein
MLIESVVCFKWKPVLADARFSFGPETVNVLKAMVRRHYRRDVRFICVTDDASGIDQDVEIVPLWTDYADLMSPHGGRNPACYRRLKSFSAEIASVFGQRFVTLDLDCVITGDMRSVWDRPEDFIMWGDTNPQPGSHYNGSMIQMTAGSRRKVWETFDPVKSPRQAKQAGCYGSDQGWISYCLGPGEAKWTKADGVFSFRNHFQQGGNHMNLGKLPDHAKIIFFHGRVKPWSREAEQVPWVSQFWRHEVAA